MPFGVFKPYAGISTGVLIFTKTCYGGTDNVWFYDMTQDLADCVVSNNTKDFFAQPNKDFKPKRIFKGI